jgi:membrane-associated phospholipid phosphatase
MERRNAAIISAVALAATVVSCLYLDHPIALFVRKLALRRRALAADIPDLLFLTVLAATLLLWGGYLYRHYRGIDDTRTGFFRLAAWTVPLAFVLKSVLKQLFGRMNTRGWLIHQPVHDFRWFQGGEGYTGFPSGHMAVFAAFMVSAWLYYPRFRSLYLVLMLVLGAALIATNYHFLGDVIAGAWLGVMVNVCVARYMNVPMGRK